MEIDQYANTISKNVNDAIKKAFISGMQYARSLCLDDCEFVDLGLPSGTRWAKEYLGVTDATPIGDFFSLVDSKKYNLPTREQVEELKNVCSFVYDGKTGTDVFGPNGNKIHFERNFRWSNLSNKILENYPGTYCATCYFWCFQDCIESDNVAYIWKDANLRSSVPAIATRAFSGKECKCMIRLVKCS